MVTLPEAVDPLPEQTVELVASIDQAHVPVPEPPPIVIGKVPFDTQVIALPLLAVSVIAAWALPVISMVLAVPYEPARYAPTAFALA